MTDQLPGSPDEGAVGRLERRLDDLQAAVGGLDEHVRRNDREIDVLQAQAAHATSPWYKRASTWSVIVAMLAIAFSGWTTWLSSQRLAQEDVQNDRAEVRELLQRLAQLQAEFVQANVEADPLVGESLRIIAQQEQLLIARQALEVMQRIPEQVTSNEYLLVGNTLMGLDKLADAQAAFSLALEKTEETGDDADRIQVLQAQAQLAFFLQRFDEGRDLFAEALAVYRERPPSSAYLVPYTTAVIEAQWASVELATGNCSEATAHLDAARAATAAVLESLQSSLYAGIDSLAAAPCTTATS